MYRQTWYRNQMLLAGLVRTVRCLSGAGIETLPLKGAALVLLYYRDPGVR